MSSRHLIVEFTLVSFELCVLFLFEAGARLDVGVLPKILCFVRRVNDDRLFLRFHGHAALWDCVATVAVANAVVAVATVATASGGRIAASMALFVTHRFLVLGRR